MVLGLGSASIGVNGVALASIGDRGDAAGDSVEPVRGEFEALEPSRRLAENGAEGDGGIRIGDPSPEAVDEDKPQPEAWLPEDWAFGVESVRLDAGWLPRSASYADLVYHGHLLGRADWQPRGPWSARVESRVDGHYQRGGPRVEEIDVDYGEVYLRYRGRGWRLTAGAQQVVWGRIDEVSPTDRLSVEDLSRFVLDDLSERRRAAPAVRGQLFTNGWEFDAVVVPWFREAEMPDRDSVWHPVDRQRGRFLGLPSEPQFQDLVRDGRFVEETDGEGGAGLRVSRGGRGWDAAATFKRFRHSAPYYELSDEARGALDDPEEAVQAGDYTFRAVHPRSYLVGVDGAIDAGGVTYRAEAVWLSDVPGTRQEDFVREDFEAFNWGVGAEVFPGDGDLRVNVQLVGSHYLDAPSLLERADEVTLNGEIEGRPWQRRLRARLRYAIGLDERDIYLNPEVAWVDWEPHELYVSAHYFEGAEETAGGFHQDNDVIMTGWRGRF
ncbi:conserved hypothetical protein [Halorhodospira halophila SL1]|uniref:Alginate export domain-containing protein n=1 Tax=Halorhodospira halophila (strain DSM 244 / SL1) TaxID=349124 RepID=A1WX82_HALHL|nr:conserved hypothetical protein [Halorhodospira halophila SL1]